MEAWCVAANLSLNVLRARAATLVVAPHRRLFVYVQVADGVSAGIIARAVRRVFDGLAAQAGAGDSESHVKVSFLEIYNERLDDLLAAEPSSFAVGGGGSAGACIRRWRRQCARANLPAQRGAVVPAHRGPPHPSRGLQASSWAPAARHPS
jgi:hypothetical protein